MTAVKEQGRLIKTLLLAALVATMAVGNALASKIVIIDGDTLDIDGERVRIVEIDTPETFHSRCEHELVLGLKAKERLRALVNTGDVVYEPAGMDRYGRTLAKVFVRNRDRNIDVGETLLREGYALRYHAGSEAKRERLRAWCGPDASLDEGVKWTGSADTADRHRPGSRPGDWLKNIPRLLPTKKCEWWITPTWGPSWCGNPLPLKG